MLVDFVCCDRAGAEDDFGFGVYEAGFGDKIGGFVEVFKCAHEGGDVVNNGVLAMVFLAEFVDFGEEDFCVGDVYQSEI